MPCKIYLLINKITNKFYVGQTWEDPLEKRMGKNGKKYENSTYLYNSIKKYGADNYKYKLLTECEDQNQANWIEEQIIEETGARETLFGYNLMFGGRGGKHSEETKAKISETLRNKDWSDEATFNKGKRGRSLKGQKGTPFSEERKKETSLKSIEWHANNPHPMLGKHHTDEAKTKISNSLKSKSKEEK